MKVLVSSCTLGMHCKYNGKSNESPAVIHFLKDKDVIEVCPELLAGMPVPRACAEIVGGAVMDENGKDVTMVNFS